MLRPNDNGNLFPISDAVVVF